MIGFAGGLASRYRGIDLVTSTSGEVVDSFVQTDDASFYLLHGSQGVGTEFEGVAQSWQSGEDPAEVTGVVARLDAAGSVSGRGVLRAAIYAHTGVFGTSSKPTGAPLAVSQWFAMDSLGASPANYFFPMSGWTPDASTDYTVAVEHDVPFGTLSNSPTITYETGAAATHDGNAATKSATSEWSATTDDIAFAVYESSTPAAGDEGYRFRGNSFNRRRFGGLWAILLLFAVGCTSPTAMRADPCFAMTLHVDTLTLEVDSITYEWTPGECG